MLPDDLYSRWNPTTETKDSGPAETPDMASDGKGTITVLMGGKHHLVDPNTIPIFKTLMASRSPGSEKTPFIHDDIPFFDAINYSVQNGLRNLFRRMPPQLQAYRALCESLDSLGIDVRQGLNLRDTTKLLKVESDDCDPEERRVIKSSKTGALAYNAVSYVVSHRRIFGYRARRMVRQAFEATCPLTYKQGVALDEWPVTEPTHQWMAG